MLLPRLSRHATGLVLVCLLIFAIPARALTADQLLLITNRNVAASATLAQLYAQQRHVPTGRILELDLPTTEELSFDIYERQVVPVVRDYLRKNQLDRQVTCLATFYGVPIRIAARLLTPTEREELARLQTELAELPAKTEPMVAELEQLAASCDPAFITVNGQKNDLDALGHRAEAAMQRLGAFANAMRSVEKREELTAKVRSALRPLVGPLGMIERQLNTALAMRKGSIVPAPATQLVNSIETFRTSLRELLDRRYDAISREQLRALIRDNLGPFELTRLLQKQIAYFSTDNTIAAFDNELALLWWDQPRAGWIANPLHYSAPVRPRDPLTLMVSRLDGPQSGTAREIMVTSLKAETEGLKGRIVIDSRGLPAEKKGRPDPYGQYDQTMRNLAELLQAHGRNVSLVFDEEEAVLRPGAVKGVAVYCGWYNVAKYVPACDFNQGAVAFHLASYTMATLRLDDPRGWCRGMLLDGAAVTFGPVDEPYLHSFPRADDFFPLLFTGKLTLAETYWKTTPLVSWMQTLIGDPLYTPYQLNPVLRVEDLPPRIATIFARPATRPASLPAPLPPASSGQTAPLSSPGR